jgi:hypothetical protein
MKLDGKNVPTHDPESRSLWAFQLGKRNNKMRGFGVVGPLDVCFGRLAWAMRMGMKDRQEIFSPLAKIA